MPCGLEVHLLAVDKRKFPQSSLLQATRRASVSKPGYWPFAAVQPPICVPRPKASEIVAEVDDSYAARLGASVQHCYWALSESGEFFGVEGYLEDLNRIPGKAYLFADWRVLRVVEVLRFTRLLYESLGFDKSVLIRVEATHRALAGRLLGNAGGSPFVPPHRATTEEQVSAQVEVKLGEFSAQIPTLVKAVTANLFGFFNFFALTEEEYLELSKWALTFLESS